MIAPAERYLNLLSTKLDVSNVAGVGTFAIRDIEQGSLLFPIWKEQTGYYQIEVSKINTDVFNVVRKYFAISETTVNVFFIQELSFWHPWKLYINHSSSNNINSLGYSTKKIFKGEEIFLNYTKLNTSNTAVQTVPKSIL